MDTIAEGQPLDETLTLLQKQEKQEYCFAVIYPVRKPKRKKGKGKGKGAGTDRPFRTYTKTKF